MIVKLFGQLAEKAGSDTLEMDAADLDGLRAALRKRIPDLDDLVSSVAVNQCFVEGNKELKGNEEVAFMPPFAGG